MNGKEIDRKQIILLRDSIESIEDIDAYDINVGEVWMEPQAPQGEFVYYDGRRFESAENDPTVVMYTELNRQLANAIGYLNYGSRPQELTGKIEKVSSCHVNVGHGNCSIIVFLNNGNWNIWMVDCSTFDFTNKNNYCKNLDDCMAQIKNDTGIDSISKLLVTHLHYDHINGIEHLIKKGWITKDTEVWMNVQYPWKQRIFIRICSQLQSLGVKFIDPIVSNSTDHIKILHPFISFNDKNPAPRNNINNASVLYQICLGREKMLFTGDIEMEGWDTVLTCMPRLCGTTYYCISHHGSITGHIRNNCIPAMRTVRTIAECACKTGIQILMGRNGAYRGIYSQKVLSGFGKIVKTEDAPKYVRIEWESGRLDKR
ncbi:MAG: MBL fold metallo-hydrolase [Lachnospiraceae bacterium]|nr:MBL fold metallo-hydrolase [Lachnospiraceae bacterium]